MEWISVNDRLPENEKRVLVCAETKRHDGSIRKIIAIAMYEDGTMNTGNSGCNWDDNEFEYNEDLDEDIIPQGWWEQPIYSETFCAVDDFITHWIPLPESPK